MAPKMNIKFGQEDFIYDLNWDSKIDGCFIDKLSMDASIGEFVWPSKTMKTLIATREIINKQFGHDFSYVYINQKLDSLEERYSTFKWMLRHDGVTYDPITNKMTFEQGVFRELVAKNHYVGAYRTEGEARYDDLCEIFAQEPVDVVQISSEERSKVDVKNRGKAKVGAVDLSKLARPKNRNVQYGPFMPSQQAGGNTVGGGIFTVVPMVPLDQLVIPKNTSKTPSLNHWDNLTDFSDDDSTGTDVSTANSFNCGTPGVRLRLDRKERKGTCSRFRVSASDSCSPNGKDGKQGPKYY